MGNNFEGVIGLDYEFANQFLPIYNLKVRILFKSGAFIYHIHFTARHVSEGPDL